MASLLVNWISGLGGVLFDAQRSQVTLDDGQAVTALGVLQDLLQDGCAYCVTETGADHAGFAAEKILFSLVPPLTCPSIPQRSTIPRPGKTGSLGTLCHAWPAECAHRQCAGLGHEAFCIPHHLSSWPAGYS